jgi:AI-2 transport protein TqsA
MGNTENPPVANRDDSTRELIWLESVALWIVILAGGWYLLRELGVILKPLLLAVLLGYIIIPIHTAVRRRFHGKVSVVVLAALPVIAILGLASLIQTAVRTISTEMPEYLATKNEMLSNLNHYLETKSHFLHRMYESFTNFSADSDTQLNEYYGRAAGIATDTVSTGLVVALYLLFMLLEAGRFPEKVKKAFSERYAGSIATMITSINHGISYYLRAKVQSSLVLAVPVFLVLIVFQTRLALVWAALTFFCNFIPYIGSVVAYSVPVTYALMQFKFGWEWLTIAVLLLAIHILSAMILEPKILGRAVGISPVVILFSLAFWGYCWGLSGMLLAVPLTVIFKIICEHVDTTRPIAKLIADR